jgi:hypothetical protein
VQIIIAVSPNICEKEKKDLTSRPFFSFRRSENAMRKFRRGFLPSKNISS